MPGKIKIYTKTGDLGETSLCNGSRTSKDAARVDAYGDIDELNANIGLCIIKSTQLDIQHHLTEIQKDLHAIGANLAFPADLSQVSIEGSSAAVHIPKIEEKDVAKLESWIDKYEKELPPIVNFILCGGTEDSAMLHVARTVCRRAERRVVHLRKSEEVSKQILKYVNRLSDYLFTAARLASHRQGKQDRFWRPA